MTLIKSISGIRGTVGGAQAGNLTPPDVVKFTTAYARLAARLTGYKIDIKPASQEQELKAIDAQPDEAPEDAEPQA